MNIEQVRDFVLSLYGVTEDQPFGDDNITFRVEGKIFLCLWLANDKQGARDEAVTPAFHWNKKHWSDIYYEQLEPEQVMAWIVESYELIVSKLPKAVRANFI